MNSIFIIVRTTDTAAASATTPTPLRLPSRVLPVPDLSRPGSVPAASPSGPSPCCWPAWWWAAPPAQAARRPISSITKPDTVVYQGERPTVDVDTVANSNGGQPMTPEQLYAANLASCVGITVSTTGEHLRPDHHLGGQRLRLCPHPGRLHRHQLPRDRGRGQRLVRVHPGVLRQRRQVHRHPGGGRAGQRRGRAEDRRHRPAARHPGRLRPAGGGRDGVHHRQPPGRADLLPVRRPGVRSGPADHHQQHQPDHRPEGDHHPERAADQLRHQPGQLRRPPV